MGIPKHWGDNAPIIGPDRTDSDDAAKALHPDSYKLVGSVCKNQGCLDGNHDPGCPGGN